MKVGRIKQNLLNLATWKRYSPIHVIDVYKNECINWQCTGSPKDPNCSRVFLALFKEEDALLDALLLQFSDASYLDHRVNSSLLLSAQNFPFIIWLSIEIFPQSEGMWWSSWHKKVALYSNTALGNRDLGQVSGSAPYCCYLQHFTHMPGQEGSREVFGSERLRSRWGINSVLGNPA